METQRSLAHRVPSSLSAILSLTALAVNCQCELSFDRKIRFAPTMTKHTTVHDADNDCCCQSLEKWDLNPSLATRDGYPPHGQAGNPQASYQLNASEESNLVVHSVTIPQSLVLRCSQEIDARGESSRLLHMPPAPCAGLEPATTKLTASRSAN